MLPVTTEPFSFPWQILWLCSRPLHPPTSSPRNGLIAHHEWRRKHFLLQIKRSLAQEVTSLQSMQVEMSWRRNPVKPRSSSDSAGECTAPFSNLVGRRFTKIASWMSESTGTLCASGSCSALLHMKNPWQFWY